MFAKLFFFCFLVNMGRTSIRLDLIRFDAILFDPSEVGDFSDPIFDSISIPFNFRCDSIRLRSIFRLMSMFVFSISILLSIPFLSRDFERVESLLRNCHDNKHCPRKFDRAG